MLSLPFGSDVFGFLREFHFHLEHKGRPFIDTGRVNIYLPFAVLNDLLTDSQAHAYAIRVRVLSALKFTE